MRPEPLSGVGRLLRLLRARAFACPRNGCLARFCARAAFFSLALCFYALAVLMLGIRPDCLRYAVVPRYFVKLNMYLN